MQHASHSWALDMHVWEGEKAVPAVWMYGPGEAKRDEPCMKTNGNPNS